MSIKCCLSGNFNSNCLEKKKKKKKRSRILNGSGLSLIGRPQLLEIIMFTKKGEEEKGKNQ